MEAKKKHFWNRIFIDYSKGTLTISGSGNYPGPIEYKNEVGNLSNYPMYKYKQKLKKIIIEEGITSIGKGAFSDKLLYDIKTQSFLNSSIQELQLPSSLKTIEMSAFEGSRINHILFPEGIQQIGYRAFDGEGPIYTGFTHAVKKFWNVEAFGARAVHYLFIPEYINKANCDDYGISLKEMERYLRCEDGVYDSTYRQIIAPRAGRMIKREIDDVTGERYYLIKENGLWGAIDKKGDWITELSDIKTIENAAKTAIAAHIRNPKDENARQRALTTLRNLHYIEGSNSLDVDPNYQLGHYYSFGRFDDGEPFSKKGILPIDAKKGFMYLKHANSGFDLYKLFADNESWLYDPQIAIECYTLTEGYIGGAFDDSDFVNKILNTDTKSYVDIEALFLRRYAEFVERENENDLNTVLAFFPSQLNSIVDVAEKMPTNHYSANMNLTNWGSDSLFMLGLGYHNERKFSKALYYFRRAAVKGNANAYTMSVIALDSIIRNTCYDAMGKNLETNYRVAYAFTQFFPWEKEGKEKYAKEQQQLMDFYTNSCELIKAEWNHQKLLALQKKAEADRQAEAKRRADEAEAEARRSRRLAFFSGLLQGVTQMATGFFNPNVAYTYNSGMNQLLNPNVALMQTIQQNAQFQQSLNASLQSSMAGLNSLMQQSQQLFQQKLATWSPEALSWENEHPMGYIPTSNNISEGNSSNTVSSNVEDKDSHTNLQGRFCDSCRGRGLCGKCEGNPKGLWSSYAGHSGWIKCTFCTNGKCNICGGEGRRL